MPLFYFDVREGTRFVLDDDGLEFATVEVAEREAAMAAAEIGRDRLPNGDAREVTIGVSNEHRQRIITVMVSLQIDRVQPPPVASVS